MWLVCETSCIFPPPLNPEPIEPNYPPYLTEMNPESAVLRVESAETIDLSVRPADLNEEERINFVWIGEESGVIRGPLFVGPEAQQPTPVEGAADFVRFQRVSLTVDPCSEDLRPVDRETIWVFVSDRTLFIRGQADVETEEDGYIDAWSWVLEFEPGICQ